jgi:TolA-binding protein
MSLFERLNSLFTRLRISFGPAEKAQAIKSQKESLDSSLDFHITILEKLKYSTQINDDLTELEAQSIISSADSKISELEQMKLLVSRAQSQAELDDAKAQIQPLIKDIIPEVKSQSVRLMQTRLSEVVKRDEETQRKLECSLNAMKARNISTDKIDEKLGELSAKVLFAKDDLRKAEENSHQGNYTLAELKTISAQIKLSDCYLTMKDIVKDIKASKGTIIDCVSLSPDTVVVAEET